MTPKDRAKLASRGAGCGRPLSTEDVDVLRCFIEEQVVAAIEEEREAFIAILKNETLRLVGLEEGAKLKGLDAAQARAKYARESCERVWREIRARSVSKPLERQWKGEGD